MQTELSRDPDSRRFGFVRRHLVDASGATAMIAALADDVPSGLPVEGDPDDFPDEAIPSDNEHADEADHARRLADELLSLRHVADAHDRAHRARDIASRLVLPDYLRDFQDPATRRWMAEEDWAPRARGRLRECWLMIDRVVRCFDSVARGFDVVFGDDARLLRAAVVELRKMARHHDTAAAAERTRADRAYRAWTQQCRARRMRARALRCYRRARLVSLRTRTRTSRRARTVARAVARSTGDPDGDPEPPRPRALRCSAGGVA